MELSRALRSSMSTYIAPTGTPLSRMLVLDRLRESISLIGCGVYYAAHHDPSNKASNILPIGRVDDLLQFPCGKRHRTRSQWAPFEMESPYFTLLQIVQQRLAVLMTSTQCIHSAEPELTCLEKE
jgi:hypothetical protein